MVTHSIIKNDDTARDKLLSGSPRRQAKELPVEADDLGGEVVESLNVRLADRAFDVGKLGKELLGLECQLLSKSFSAHLLHLLLLLGSELLGGVLRERALDHLLDAERLDTEQVEDHVVRQTELRRETVRHAEHHLLEFLDLKMSAEEVQEVRLFDSQAATRRRHRG